MKPTVLIQQHKSLLNKILLDRKSQHAWCDNFITERVYFQLDEKVLLPSQLFH